MENEVRSKKGNVFLGGPISNAIRKNVFDKKIENDIRNVYEKLKNKGYEVLSAHIIEEFGKKPPCVEEMFGIDISWIDEAESAVFILSYNEKKRLPRTDGSYIEIGICYAKGIPITIISDAPREKFPTMLRSMIDNNEVKFITFDKFY